MFRATQKYFEEVFEDVDEEKLREVPEDYTKPHYYARKTCNYLTSVFQVSGNKYHAACLHV